MIPENNTEALQKEIDGDVHTAYKQCVESGKIGSLIELYEKTGIWPRLKEEQIQEAYANIFADCTFMQYKIDNIVKLRKFTRCEFVMDDRMKEAVQKGYMFCFESGWPDEVAKMESLSGRKPKMDRRMKESLQKGYATCLSRGLNDMAKKMKELTGIGPSLELLRKHHFFSAEYEYQQLLREALE